MADPTEQQTQPVTTQAMVEELQRQVSALQSSMKAMVERLAIHGIYVEPTDEVKPEPEA